MKKEESGSTHVDPATRRTRNINNLVPNWAEIYAESVSLENTRQTYLHTVIDDLCPSFDNIVNENSHIRVALKLKLH
jgi:hypothetical protein